MNNVVPNTVKNAASGIDGVLRAGLPLQDEYGQLAARTRLFDVDFVEVPASGVMLVFDVDDGDEIRTFTALISPTEDEPGDDDE